MLQFPSDLQLNVKIDGYFTHFKNMDYVNLV